MILNDWMAEFVSQVHKNSIALIKLLKISLYHGDVTNVQKADKPLHYHIF